MSNLSSLNTAHILAMNKIVITVVKVNSIEDFIQK